MTCQGNITATPGGAINLANGLIFSGTGQVNLGSGTLTVNDPNSGVSGRGARCGMIWLLGFPAR